MPGPAPSVAPAPAAAARAATPIPQLELLLRLALAAAIGFQVVQRFTYTGYGMSEYGRSLWYVNYSHGFVRRGLAGEVLRTIVGGRPTIATIDLVQNIVAVVTITAMVGLVVLLVRRRTVVAYGAAAALVIAPFAFDSVGGQRRPDLLAFLLLTGIGLWAATRRPPPMRLALVAGALLAVCALASEVAPLIVLPWLVLVVVAATRARRGPHARVVDAIAVTVAPSAIVLALLAARGAPSPVLVQSLELDAPGIIAGRGSVFFYLGDSLGGSFQRVIERSHPELSILLGGALVGLLVLAFRGARPYVVAVRSWLLPGRAQRTLWWVGTVLLTTVVFALGFDWLRWITVIAFAALLAFASIVAIDGRLPARPPERERWHHPLPTTIHVSATGVVAAAIAIYLVVLPPLPNFVTDVVKGARLLLDVPQ